MTIQALALFLGGLALVVGGADLLVRGSANLAGRFRVPPLVIGLTIVAFATSSPEFVISMRAALLGDSSIAVGNVVGSNIFNVLFILGASSLVAPLAVSESVIRRDVPIMIGCSGAVLLLALNQVIGTLEGVLLMAGLIVYLAIQVRSAAGVRRARDAQPNSRSTSTRGTVIDRRILAIDGALVAGGLLLLALGSRWFVDGAASIAVDLGVSQLVIGLTLVAGGTSLPELATSVLASARGERDIAVGNIVGSNIFNILFVLGATAAVSPEGVAVPPAALSFDLPVMAVVALACLPIFFTGFVISRWEGAVFLGYYGAYLSYLVLHATQHEALVVFRQVLLVFVLPLTAITVVVIVYRSWRVQRRGGQAAREPTVT